MKNCSNLKTINMPDSITSIRSSAFRNCSRIFLDNLPSNLVTIGDYAFENCSMLNELIFPDKLAEIGTGILKNSGLKTITINPLLKKYDIKMFSGCKNVVVNVKCNTAAYKAFKSLAGCSVNCVKHDNSIQPKARLHLRKTV